VIRPSRTSAFVALTVATQLTLGVVGSVPEQTAMDRNVTTWSEPVPVPDPVVLTAPRRAPGPGPTSEPHRPDTSPPARLDIELLGVSAPVEQVGVLPDGSMEIPEDIRIVGWYATEHRSVSPGDAGTAVIAGHRDSRIQGFGALHDLALIPPGALISIVHTDGRLTWWRVEQTLTTLRSELPADLLFSREGPPRLALITCGGTFDRQTRSYSHNTIVLAEQIETGHRPD
jgi:hypothetical protein